MAKKEEAKDSAAKKKHGHPAEKKAAKKAIDWVEFKPKEIEELVVNLANQGHNSSEIGMILRDQYGVPNVKDLTGKKIEAILAENNLLADIPRELLNLIRQSVNLWNHLNKNKKDFSAKRGYQLTVSKIRRLAAYYQERGKLDAKWRYTPEQAALMVK
ncbi:MAG: 30S ribosomal protein S15 [Candidatus Diapherotrites archaeon]